MSYTAEDARVVTLLLAERKLGAPYLWGGEGEAFGYDCSGFVSSVFSEARRFFPELYDGQRRTAHGLLQYFRARGLEPRADDFRPGCLVFHMKPPSMRATHVKLHVADLRDTAVGRVGRVALDAGGAGSESDDHLEALRRGAGVRYSLSTVHTGSYVLIDPFELIEDE